MPIYTTEDVRAAILALRTADNAATVDAVIDLLTATGVLGGISPEAAAAMLRRSAIRVRQCASDG